MAASVDLIYLFGLNLEREMQKQGPRHKTHIKILHTSDNHIGGETVLKQQPAGLMGTCIALGLVVDKAKQLEVDIVVFAGDFIDNSRVNDGILEETVAHLKKLDIPVVLVPGNHDQLDGKSVYHRKAFEGLPPNIFIVKDADGRTIDFDRLGVKVWARPTYDHTADFRPLEQVPPRQGEFWHIGVVHGFYVPNNEETDRSSPISAAEIESTGYDYIALGHSDYFTDLSQGQVRAAYSGAPIESSDGSKLGCVLLVELDPVTGVDFRQIQLP